jgi:glycerophosphoryl diester phosphodiesterase
LIAPGVKKLREQIDEEMKRCFSDGTLWNPSETEYQRKSFEMMDIKDWPATGNYDGTIQSQFATFDELFEAVKVEREEKSVGFNIEIKYPDVDEAEANHLAMAEINFYVDKIINASLEKAKNRHLVFSSFHTDVIIGVKLKQVSFPGD